MQTILNTSAAVDERTVNHEPPARLQLAGNLARGRVSLHGGALCRLPRAQAVHTKVLLGMRLRAHLLEGACDHLIQLREEVKEARESVFRKCCMAGEIKLKNGEASCLSTWSLHQ